MAILGFQVDLITSISVLSLITTVVGLILLGEKKASGFLVFTASLLCQAYIFYVENNKFLILQMVVLIAFNIKNFFKWVKEKSI